MTVVDITALQEGMVLAENIFDNEGNILLACGIRLKASYIRKIEGTAHQQVAVIQAEIQQDSNSAKPIVSTMATDDVRNSSDWDWNEFQEQVRERRRMRLDDTRKEGAKVLKNALDRLIDGQMLNGAIIMQVVQRMIQDILNSDEIVFHIDQLRELDDYHFDHAINVAILCIVTGVVSGKNQQELKQLGMAGMLHDVGKVFVDQELLNRPTTIDEDEMNALRLHCRLGFEMLSAVSDIGEIVAKAALQHHEHLDGSGYPNGLSSDDIHMVSRVVSIADVFDAITADKVYAHKLSPYKAVRELVRLCDYRFYTELVKRFVSAVGYYYHGAVVLLHNDAVGVVSERDRYRPVVRVIYVPGVEGNRANYEIDLKKNPAIRIKSILIESEYSHLPYFSERKEGIS